MDIQSNELNIPDLNKPLVVSYDNNIAENAIFYINTLNNNNWEYLIVGQGDVWNGFISKIKGYIKFLKTLPSDKIVILTDARDVICCRSPHAFMDAFNSFGGNMVVSMELYCEGYMDINDTNLNKIKCVQSIPITQYWKKHNIIKLPDRKYVNSGLICGKVKQLLHELEWAINNNYSDDQLALCNYINAFPDNVTLDIDATLLHTSTFGVCAGIQQIHVQKNDSPTFAEFLGRGSFFLHIPGCHNKGQKTVYNLACKLIDLGICERELREPYGYSEPKWYEIF